MRVTLIHNPKAGDPAVHSEAKLVALLRDAGHEVTYHSSKVDGWKKLLKQPADVVAVAGGDGTIARVARRMAGRSTPVAPLPAGTANNLARTLGLAGRPHEELVRGWEHGQIVRLDVGEATGPWGSRKVMEGLGAGLFAASIPRANNDAALEAMPHADAKVTYSLQMLKDRLDDGAPLRIRAELDGEDVSGEYLLFEAMIIPYVGPNLFLAPDSKPGDGCFELVLAGEAERERLRRYFAHWQDGKERVPVLPSRRGKHLRLSWGGCPVHVDDQAWPDEEWTGPRFGLIEVKLEGVTTRFLAPAAKGPGAR